MNRVVRTSLIALMFTLSVTAVSAEEKIELKLDPSTGQLTINCGMTTNLGSIFNRRISWELADPLIDSFHIVGKKGDDPFTERPNIRHGKILELRVRFFKWKDDWSYKIVWFARGSSTPNVCDPVIAVRPTTTLWIALIVSISLLFGIGVYRYASVRRRNKQAGGGTT